MKFISPEVHGILDYSVATVLVAGPLVLRFSDVSIAVAVIAVLEGVGLFVYSLLTNYSAGLRAVIPFRSLRQRKEENCPLLVRPSSIYVQNADVCPG